MLQAICTFYGGSQRRSAPLALSAATPRARVAVEKCPSGFATRFSKLTLHLRDPTVPLKPQVWHAEGSDDEDDDALGERLLSDRVRASYPTDVWESDHLDWHRVNVWPDGVSSAHVLEVARGSPHDGGLPASVMAASWWLCKCAVVAPVLMKVHHVTTLAALRTVAFAEHVFVMDCFDCTESGLVDLSPLGACPRLRTVIAPDDVLDLSWASACPLLTQVRLYCKYTANVAETLPSCANLRHVHLLGEAGGDARWVAQCRALQFFSCDSVPIADDAHLLDDLSELEEVDLDVNCESVLKALSVCPSKKLRSVCINGWGAMGADLSCLAALGTMDDLMAQNFQMKSFSWIAGCKALTHVRLFNCDLHDCEALAQLPRLRSLNVDWCHHFHLRWLPNCHILEEVSFGQMADGELTGFDGLRAHFGLRKVSITNLVVDDFEWLHACKHLESVSLAGAFTRDTMAPFSGPGLHTNELARLRKLSISDWSGVASVADFATWMVRSAPHLRYLELKLSGEASTALATAVSQLGELQQLVIDGVATLPHALSIPASVVRLALSNCADVESLVSHDDDGRPSALRALTLSSMESLYDVGALAHFHALTYLALDKCTSVSELPSLDLLPHLAFLSVSEPYALDLAALRTTRCLRFLELTCGAESQITDWAALGELEWLEWLAVRDASLTSVPCLAGCTSLSELELRSCAELVDVSAVGALVQLRNLWLEALGVTSLSGLETCASLVTLDIRNCAALVDLTALSALDRLCELTLMELPGMTELDWIRGCRSLGAVSIRRCDALENVSGLGSLTGLHKLWISGGCLSDVSALGQCASLTKLYFENCTKLCDVSALGQLKRLAYINLYASKVDDVSWVQGLTALNTLVVSKCVRLRDLSPLMHLPALTTIHAQESGVADMDWVYEATAPLRDVNIAGCKKQLMLDEATLPAFVRLKEDY